MQVLCDVIEKEKEMPAMIILMKKCGGAVKEDEEEEADWHPTPPSLPAPLSLSLLIKYENQALKANFGIVA